MLASGINRVVNLVERKQAQLVLIAHDVDPIEIGAPLLPSTKSTTNTSKTWLKLLKPSGLTTMRGLKKLGNTGVVESWVLNLKLRLTRGPGLKLWQRVRRPTLWSKLNLL